MMQSSRDLDLSLYFSNADPQTQRFAGMVRQELLLMHHSATSAFLYAHSAVPHIVQNEAPPMLFALNCGTSTRDAVLRLAGYWSNRSLLLGSRAFNPIRENEFAIKNDARIFLSTVISPATAPGAGNLGLLVAVDAALIRNFDQEDNMRCLFLKLHEGLRSAVPKITLAFLRVESASVMALGSFIDGAAAVITNGMPFSVDKVFVAGLGGANSPPLFSFAVSQVLQSRLCQDCIVASSGSAEELDGKLQSYGLATSNPLFRPDPIATRQAPATSITPPGPQIAHVEPNVEISAPQGSNSESVGGPASFPLQPGLDDIQSLEASGTSRPPESPCSEEKDSSVGSASRGRSKVTSDEEKRKRNAIYSRRKYVRKKIELEVLEQECGRLRAQNHGLKAEQAILESLVKQANAIVDGSGLLDQKPTAIETTSAFQERQIPRTGNAGLAAQALSSAAGQTFPAAAAGGYAVGSPLLPAAHSHSQVMVALQGEAPTFARAFPRPGAPTSSYLPTLQPVFNPERAHGALTQNGDRTDVGSNLLNPDLSQTGFNAPGFNPLGTSPSSGSAAQQPSQADTSDLLSMLRSQRK